MASIAISHLEIDKQILIIDKTICESIDRFGTDERGYLSQVILAQLRNFTEHIMLRIYANGYDIENTYDNICNAIRYVKTRGDLKQLRLFHNFLQIVTSHYTLDKENSERLMLKYYEYLLKIKILLKKQYSLDVLDNLYKFPISTDSDLKEYYEKIADRIVRHRVNLRGYSNNDRFYIQKVKPFFVDNKIFYEVTFTPANEKVSTFDRFIAFTDLEISSYYSARLYLVNDTIEILDKTMRILIIDQWESSIRPCELNNFAGLLGVHLNIQTGHSEYRKLMQYLTETGFSLVDVIDFPDASFHQLKHQILPNSSSKHFFDVLERCREIINFGNAGSNILRYLLFHLTNKITRDQRDSSNDKLSGLYLSNRCIPFDEMPFNTSLIGHNPKLSDLFESINVIDRKHEILARLVRNNTETKGQLYTPINTITDFNDIEGLANIYNKTLWTYHTRRKLVIENGHIFIKEYEDDTLSIICKLMELTQSGVSNYANSVNAWLNSKNYVIDSHEKSSALMKMFEMSKVALIYGSAGTGKSTLINHISHFFAKNSKLYLANTNPAVDNLKRRVTSANCTLLTIAKFLKRQNTPIEYDILFIDECSTVSNRDMCSILEKASFKLLVLVGDVYQIESIRFGNWFSAARKFIPNTSVFELTTPFRSKSPDLLELWNRVRKMDETILELITRKGYSATLNTSIFEPAEADEIILCLNYDGLYGINNINRFLQQSNPNPAMQWGIQIYKVNDPILFNESERFAPLIYNNMKGGIVGIKIFDEKIQFDIELDKVINGLDAANYDFELLDDSPNGNSVIRFITSKIGNTDDDDDISSLAIVPFQVAYAVSIHKAQGLEYNSVKIVITDEVDELITHNIFYTAITRAREKLRIYWTPEVEKKVLSNIEPRNNDKDVVLLRKKLYG